MDRTFTRHVRDAFGLVRSFWLIDAGPRAVWIACNEALKAPRDAAHRELLEALRDLSRRMSEAQAAGVVR